MIKREAWISHDEEYRYTLSRVWNERDGDPKMMSFIMLNPSKADANIDDRTISKCMGTANRWGYDGIYVANLFALRATDPREINLSSDPVGPDNNEAIIEVGYKSDLVVAAWGVPMNKKIAHRIEEVEKLLWPKPLHALALSRDGHPRHPLYLPIVVEPLLWKFSIRGEPYGRHS